MESGAKWALGCTITCSLLIIWSSLLGVSFDTLEPNEVGIMYDGSVQRLEQTKLYNEGRYLVGLGKKFIKFPTTRQTLRYGSSFGSDYRQGGTLITRSYDGLRIEVDVSFNYQLNIVFDDLYRLYLDFGGDHASQYGRILTQVAADVCSDYVAAAFYTQREVIQEAMRAELNQSLAVHYATVPELELVNIDFYNAEYNAAILQTQVAIQDVLQAAAEQAVATVNADAAVAVAEATAITLLQTANQTAASYVASVMADADILLYTIDKQASALITLRDKLDLNSSAAILSYNYVTALLENEAQQLIMSQPFPTPLQSVINGDY